VWGEGQGVANCIDRSAELPDISYTEFYFQDPAFRCEEHTCRADEESL
ncbi:unnamed protein product, partial [Rotaria sordida]